MSLRCSVNSVDFGLFGGVRALGRSGWLHLYWRTNLSYHQRGGLLLVILSKSWSLNSTEIVSCFWTVYIIYSKALVRESLTWLCAGWIWRLMAVSWTGCALAWARPVCEPCWLSAWWLMVEWKMVACWLWADPWLWSAGLGKTGMIPATDEVWAELWMASEAVCWWGWTEAVCSNWGWVLVVGGAWGWMTNCCGCCLIRACGWIWAYAKRRNHRQTLTIVSHDYTLLHWQFQI